MSAIKDLKTKITEWWTASDEGDPVFFYGPTEELLSGANAPDDDHCWFCGLCFKGEAGFFSLVLAGRDGFKHFGENHPEITFDTKDRV